MTACFAGPFFNILMGLGLGFSRLMASTGQTEFNVTLPASVRTGFFFLIVNSAAILTAGLFYGKGFIPKSYGYVALVMYSIYLVSSISLQYSKYGEY